MTKVFNLGGSENTLLEVDSEAMEAPEAAEVAEVKHAAEHS